MHSERLSYQPVESGNVDEINNASVRVLEKPGFERVAVHRGAFGKLLLRRLSAGPDHETRGEETKMGLGRLVGAIAFALLIAAAAQAEPLPLARVTPDELTWNPTWTGAQLAVVVGHPRQAGIYVVSVRFPAGFRNPPHFHPDERIVTILSGTLLVGYGDQFEEGAMKPLSAGSVFTEPANQPHFAWAKDGEVIVQIVGHGPSATTWSPR